MMAKNQKCLKHQKFQTNLFTLKNYIMSTSYYYSYSAVIGALSLSNLNIKQGRYKKPMQSTLPDKNYN